MEDTLWHKDCKISDIKYFIEYYFPKEYNDGEVCRDGMPSLRIAVYCPSCGSEWVSSKFMTLENVNNNDCLMIGGIRYQLLTNNMYCDPNFRIPTESEKVEIFEICRGDHIFYNFLEGFMIHHAVVENVTTGDEGLHKFNLIHWKKMGSGKFEIVHEFGIDLQTKGTIKRRKYSSDYVGAENAELTIARANAMLSHLKYNFMKDNCEHFATFCKIGAFCSWQAWFAVRMVTSVTSCVLEEAAKCALTGLKLGAKVAAVKGASVAANGASVTAAGSDLLGDAVEGVVTLSDGAQLVTASTQAIGLGIVVAVQVTHGVINVALLHKAKKRGELTKQEFNNKAFQEVVSTLERIFFTGALSYGATVLVGAAVTALGITPPFSIAAIITVMVAAPIAGAVVSHYKRGFGRTRLGCLTSALTAPIVPYESINVKAVNELSPGDHVVLTKWMGHPRCHAIVYEVLEEEKKNEKETENKNEFVVIRFRHDKGVVKEIIKFYTPCYKVLYTSKLFTPNEIIERAEGKIGEELVYHILNNNCKSFARWCVLDEHPKSITSKVKYY